MVLAYACDWLCNFFGFGFKTVIRKPPYVSTFFCCSIHICIILQLQYDKVRTINGVFAKKKRNEFKKKARKNKYVHSKTKKKKKNSQNKNHNKIKFRSKHRVSEINSVGSSKLATRGLLMQFLRTPVDPRTLVVQLCCKEPGLHIRAWSPYSPVAETGK